jgi:hypothetical protein
MDESKVDSPKTLQLEMLQLYGPLMKGAALIAALGYPSSAAFRQARHRHQLPVEVFAIANRRGTFAHTADVARWVEGLKLLDKARCLDSSKEAK